MQLVLNDDQRMLAETVAGFIAERSGPSALRRLRDAKDADGFSRETWRRMAELGFTAMPFPEEMGGLGLGLADVVVVTEAMGRGLANEPLLSSVLLGGGSLSLAGTAEQRSAWLGPIQEGKAILTLAHQEKASRFDLQRVGTRAERTSSGYRLSGEKVQVLDGAAADAFIVTARTAGAEGDARGITLLLVPRSTAGVRVVPQHRVDHRITARISFDSAVVGEEAVIGAVDEGLPVLQAVVDRATVALCGEMLGGMSEALDRTLSYLKERQQFGVPIGSFQALKHRAARLFIEVELARSAVMAAARAADEHDPEARALASVAKARCSDAFLLVANEAIQMHGGIGMTDEHDIGFFLKRARALEMTFGDAAYHRDRFARLNGF